MTGRFGDILIVVSDGCQKKTFLYFGRVIFSVTLREDYPLYWELDIEYLIRYVYYFI